MKDFNIVILTGRLTKDAETRELKEGQVLTFFSLAFNRSRKNESGEWEDVPNFINISFIGKKALDYKKGEKVLVKGKFYENKYQDAKGNNRSEFKIQADECGLFHTVSEKKKEEKEEIPF